MHTASREMDSLRLPCRGDKELTEALEDQLKQGLRGARCDTPYIKRSITRNDSWMFVKLDLHGTITLPEPQKGIGALASRWVGEGWASLRYSIHLSLTFPMPGNTSAPRCELDGGGITLRDYRYWPEDYDAAKERKLTVNYYRFRFPDLVQTTNG
jgi:hypothetical protein